MKILIMVLSCNLPHYKELVQAQKDTWDSQQVDGVDTVYYYGGNTNTIKGKDVTVRCSDDWWFMGEKLAKAISLVDAESYDYVFRTDNSAYIRKDRLKEYISNAKDILYEGVLAEPYYVSGEGMILSSQSVHILSQELPYRRDIISEDETIGRILYYNYIDAEESKLKRSENINEDADYYRCISATYQETINKFKTLHSRL